MLKLRRKRGQGDVVRGELGVSDDGCLRALQSVSTLLALPLCLVRE